MFNSHMTLETFDDVLSKQHVFNTPTIIRCRVQLDYDGPEICMLI
jgi:hypothetical protein